MYYIFIYEHNNSSKRTFVVVFRVRDVMKLHRNSERYEDEVRHGQVAEEHVRHSPRFLYSHYNDNDTDVSQERRDKPQ